MADPFFKIGIVGCGRHGHALIDSINRIAPDLRPRIEALCDPWPLARASARFLTKSVAPAEFGSLRECLAKAAGRLDAMVIASPDFLHETQARSCLESGLHVYLEPPMAFTEDGARELVALSEEKSRLLQIGYHRRSHPNFRIAFAPEFREAIFKRVNIAKSHYSVPRPVLLENENPRLAVPRGILDHFGFDDMDGYLNWQRSKRFGAGWLCNEVGHQIDVQKWCLGKPVSVIGSGVSSVADSEHTDNADVVVDYVSGDGSTARAVNHLEIGHTNEGVVEIFHGIDATATFDERRGVASICNESHHDRSVYMRGGLLHAQFERRDTFNAPTREGDQQIRDRIPRVFRCVGGSGRIYDRAHYFRAPFSSPLYRAHLNNFFNGVRRYQRGEPPRLNCSARVGFDTTVACLKIEQAVEEDRRLVFDLESWLG